MNRECIGIKILIPLLMLCLSCIISYWQVGSRCQVSGLRLQVADPQGGMAPRALMGGGLCVARERSCNKWYTILVRSQPCPDGEIWVGLERRLEGSRFSGWKVGSMPQRINEERMRKKMIDPQLGRQDGSSWQ